MSPLEQAMETMILVFRKYSEKEGDKLKLNKAELKSLLEEQFPSIETRGDSEQIDEIMTALDENKDGQVDFREFAQTVATLIVIINEYFQ